MVTSVSHSLKEDTQRLFHIKKDIQVIYNFIDSDFYKSRQPPCEREIIVSREEKIITHISNFRPLKRVLDVIKTFALITEKCPAKLLMVGDGIDKSKAKPIVKSEE